MYLIAGLACKNNNIEPNPVLLGPTDGTLENTGWLLVSSGNYPTCCNGVKKFEFKKVNLKKNKLQYQFSKKTFLQTSECYECNYKDKIITLADYYRLGNELFIYSKIDSNSTKIRDSIRLLGWQGFSTIQKLTKDTLAIGVNYGFEGEYAVYLFKKIN